MNQTEVNNKLSLLAGSQSISQKHSAALAVQNKNIKTHNEALRQALIREKADRFAPAAGTLVALVFIVLFVLLRHRFQYAILIAHRIAALVLAFLAFLAASLVVKRAPFDASLQGGFSMTPQQQSIGSGILAAIITLIAYWLLFYILHGEENQGGSVEYFIIALGISATAFTFTRKTILSQL